MMNERPKSVRTEMVEFLKKNFSDLLGDDVKHLDNDMGLEYLHEKYCLRRRRW